MYPLGSCTMKYNPRVNERWRGWRGSPRRIPISRRSLSQGCLGIHEDAVRCLIEITGMDAITLQPAAGAHGEFTGILLMRAYHECEGQCAEEDSDSGLGAWDESRDGGDLRYEVAEPEVERAGHGGRGGSWSAW